MCAEPDALALLADLEEASLVVAGPDDGEACYRLLELTRAFSRQKLEQRGEWEALWGWHAAFFRAQAAQAVPELRGPDQKRWLDALEADHDNLRAARAVRDYAGASGRQRGT